MTTLQPSLFDDDPAPTTETACWRIACAACGGEIARTTTDPGPDGDGPSYTVRPGTLEEPVAQAGHTDDCPEMAEANRIGAEHMKRKRKARA